MAQKKKRTAKKQQKLAEKLAREATEHPERALENKVEEAEQGLDLESARIQRLDADEQIPQSRFTEEYKEFLKKQEPADEVYRNTEEKK